MKLTRDDFIIVGESDGCFTISFRKYIFKFIPVWKKVTCALTENTPDEILEFNTLEEASEFIDNLLQ